jgi:hypothetical protein
MGSHRPFGHLKHKSWPKERSGIKLAIWLPTIKSQELTQFPRIEATCDISFQSSQQGLQLCFRPHCNQRSTSEVMRPQSHKSPNCGNFGTPTTILGQKPIWMWPSWKCAKYTIRGKVVASPKFGPWWVLWVQDCLWFILAPIVFQLCINHLVLVLCRFIE